MQFPSRAGGRLKILGPAARFTVPVQFFRERKMRPSAREPLQQFMLLLAHGRRYERQLRLAPPAGCAAAQFVNYHRWMRAEPPLANAFTCSTVAIVVSPGNVVSNAPCAQPRLTASWGVSPVSRP